MRTTLLSGEELIKEGYANLQRGWETVGGRLYLTNQRLIFESHPFNIKKGNTVISLSNISGMRECWTKFLNRIPIMHNSIALMTTEGREYRIVVWGKQEWMEAILSTKNRVAASSL